MSRQPKPKWIEGEGYLVVILPGNAPKTVKDSLETYPDIMAALKKNDIKELELLLFPERKIEKKSKGKVKVASTGELTIKGKNVDSALTKLACELTEEGLPIEPLLRLQENIDKNDDKWIREQTFRFLSRNRVPITSDGCFIMYKGVKDKGGGKLVDCHTGRLDNSVGSSPRMKKSDVDLDPHNTCSRGLHAAAHGYVRGIYGTNVMIAVKVNPMDVCSVPYDYQDQKMRTTGYDVIAEMGSEQEFESLYFPWDKVKLKDYKPKIRSKKQKATMVDLARNSATVIIDYVLRVTKKIIPVSPKSKSSVVSHAVRILDEEGYKTDGTKAEVIIDELVQGAKKEISIAGMTAPQIVAKVEEMTGQKITFNLRSKSSIIKAAIRIFAEHGYKTEV